MAFQENILGHGGEGEVGDGWWRLKDQGIRERH